MKKIIAILLTIAFISAFSISAFAEPMRAPGLSPSLTFSGTTASCKVTVKETGKDIKVTMSLWSGGTCVASWSGSGKGVVSLSESCTVESGKSYTLQVSGTSGGTPFSATPVTKTCGG